MRDVRPDAFDRFSMTLEHRVQERAVIALRETWEDERSMGLPMDQRVVMAAPTRG